MKQLMYKIFLSCEKASELIDKKSVFGLSLKEKISLSIHTGMCSVCKTYKTQSELLDRFIDKYLQSDESMIKQQTHNELKEKINSNM